MGTVRELLGDGEVSTTTGYNIFIRKARRVNSI
jgi:hypothetical protein